MGVDRKQEVAEILNTFIAPFLVMDRCAKCGGYGIDYKKWTAAFRKTNKEKWTMEEAFKMRCKVCFNKFILSRKEGARLLV